LRSLLLIEELDEQAEHAAHLCAADI